MSLAPSKLRFYHFREKDKVTQALPRNGVSTLLGMACVTLLCSCRSLYAITERVNSLSNKAFSFVRSVSPVTFYMLESGILAHRLLYAIIDIGDTGRAAKRLPFSLIVGAFHLGGNNKMYAVAILFSGWAYKTLLSWAYP